MTTSTTETASQVLEHLQAAKLDFGQVFSGKPNGMLMDGFARPCAFTPKPDPDYVFHESARDVALWFRTPPEPLYLCGPTGAGKTSLIKNIACRLNYPVFEVTAHSRLEFDSLVGHLTYKNGTMSYQYGALALAMKYGGLFLLNEIDVTDPGVQCGLHTILDGSPLCITENEGEFIEPHPLFRFAATGNTNGSSDDTGRYQGTMQQNMAFLDRFWFVAIGYPSPEAEMRLLAKHVPQLPEQIRDRMVCMANEIREQQFANEEIEVTFSTRSLLRWARLTVLFQPMAAQGQQPIKYALDRALGYRASPSGRKVLEGLVDRHFDIPILNPSGNAAVAANQRQVSGWDYVRESLKELCQRFKSNRVAMRHYFDKYTPRVYLTQTTNQGYKFWECTGYIDKIVLRWGAMNTIGQSKEIPEEQCQNNNTLWEMLIRSEKKIMSDGYTLLSSHSRIAVPQP